jgi:hypothetical protein
MFEIITHFRNFFQEIWQHVPLVAAQRGLVSSESSKTIISSPQVGPKTCDRIVKLN